MLGDIKIDVVRHLASHAPSVLLDAVCAVPRVIDEAALPRDVALLIGLDASGYDTSPEGHRLSLLSEGIDARRVRALGAVGGKLMVYLRPDRPEANAPRQAAAPAGHQSGGATRRDSGSSRPSPASADPGAEINPIRSRGIAAVRVDKRGAAVRGGSRFSFFAD